MEKHSLLSDEDFEYQFANCILVPEIFTHQAHLRVTWLYLKKYGYEIAVRNICTQIRKFDLTHGDGTKYNQELTTRAVGLIAHLISNESSFEGFLAKYPKLITDFAGTLRTYEAMEKGEKKN